MKITSHLPSLYPIKLCVDRKVYWSLFCSPPLGSFLSKFKKECLGAANIIICVPHVEKHCSLSLWRPQPLSTCLVSILHTSFHYYSPPYVPRRSSRDQLTVCIALLKDDVYHISISRAKNRRRAFQGLIAQGDTDLLALHWSTAFQWLRKLLIYTLQTLHSLDVSRLPGVISILRIEWPIWPTNVSKEGL